VCIARGVVGGGQIDGEFALMRITQGIVSKHGRVVHERDNSTAGRGC
jgi:hypothetical protein